MAGACFNTPRLYADIDGNGVTNVFDIFCQLAVIAGGDLPDDCDALNADIAGLLGECGPNCTVNVFDIFAVLDAIAGIDPCCSPGACCLPDGSCDGVERGVDCGADDGDFAGNGTTCASTTCPLPAPAMASSSESLSRRSIQRVSAAPVQIKLVPSMDAVQPGETVDVHVFATGVTDVRGYEIKGLASGLRRGSASLVASIQDRRDGLMKGVENVSAIDQTGGPMIVAATAGSVSSAGTAYLGTFTVQVSDDAAGTLQVSLAAGPDQLILASADGSQHGVDVTPATLRITAPIEDL